ncbi:hypothetical protein HZB07_00940 [Candidatus Saganbacteria bacterium]|nr:hypothetical protein [Candidatus Saganbacteria bacterium]
MAMHRIPRPLLRPSAHPRLQANWAIKNARLLAQRKTQAEERRQLLEKLDGSKLHTLEAVAGAESAFNELKVKKLLHLADFQMVLGLYQINARKV